MTTPIERNARWLIGVMARHFPNGATSEDLRRQYERDTSLVRQSFYNALRYVKRQGWFVREEGNRLYHLNSDASWRELVASIGDVGERSKKTQLEKVQLDNDRLEYLTNSQTQQIEELQGELERLRDWTGSEANGEANVALSSLIRIVGDNRASPRQRIKAGAAILGYRVHDDGMTEFVKRVLETMCASAETPTDYRIEAGEVLRRFEAPRIALPTERPPARTDVNSAEEIVPLRELIKRRREKYEAANREQQLASLKPGRGNGGGDEPSGA